MFRDSFGTLALRILHFLRDMQHIFSLHINILWKQAMRRFSLGSDLKSVAA